MFDLSFLKSNKIRKKTLTVQLVSSHQERDWKTSLEDNQIPNSNNISKALCKLPPRKFTVTDSHTNDLYTGQTHRCIVFSSLLQNNRSILTKTAHLV